MTIALCKAHKKTIYYMGYVQLEYTNKAYYQIEAIHDLETQPTY